MDLFEDLNEKHLKFKWSTYALKHYNSVVRVKETKQNDFTFILNLKLL